MAPTKEGVTQGAPLSISDLAIATANGRAPRVYCKVSVLRQVAADAVVTFDEQPDSSHLLTYHNIPWEPPKINEPVVPPLDILIRIVLEDAARLVEDLKSQGVVATIEQVLPSMARTLEKRWLSLLPPPGAIDPAALVPVEHHEFRDANGEAVYGFRPRRDGVQPGDPVESEGHGHDRVQLFRGSGRGWSCTPEHRLTLADFDRLTDGEQVVVARWHGRISHQATLEVAAAYGLLLTVQTSKLGYELRWTDRPDKIGHMAHFAPDADYPSCARDLHGLTLYELHHPVPPIG